MRQRGLAEPVGGGAEARVQLAQGTGYRTRRPGCGWAGPRGSATGWGWQPARRAEAWAAAVSMARDQGAGRLGRPRRCTSGTVGRAAGPSSCPQRPALVSRREGPQNGRWSSRAPGARGLTWLLAAPKGRLVCGEECRPGQVTASLLRVLCREPAGFPGPGPGGGSRVSRPASRPTPWGAIWASGSPSQAGCRGRCPARWGSGRDGKVCATGENIHSPSGYSRNQDRNSLELAMGVGVAVADHKTATWRQKEPYARAERKASRGGALRRGP